MIVFLSKVVSFYLRPDVMIGDLIGNFVVTVFDVGLFHICVFQFGLDLADCYT